MRAKEKDVLLIVMLAALLFTAFYCFTGKAGSLEPYAALQPTMVTLDYISTQIEGLSSPVEKIVRGVITFPKNKTTGIDDFSPLVVDPNRSVVLLSDAVILNPDSNPDDDWISRCGACLIELTDKQIKVCVEGQAAEQQRVSYQIIEYK